MLSFRADTYLTRAVQSALCCVALCSFSLAASAQSAATSAAAPTAARDVPKILSITVVADERSLRTFQQRVSSWFNDGTEVRVTGTSEVDEQRLLASSPTEVMAWIVPLSAERALLTFSSVTPPAAPRHLVREVRLRQGFDELGLERLASVTHSAFVALSEGIEGVAREQAERELGEAGVAASSLALPGEAAAPAAVAAASPAIPLPKLDSPPRGQSPRAAAKSAASLLVSAGYGVRFRGPEGVGQGPSLALGVQLPSTLTTFDLQLSGQFLFRSAFEAPPFSASVQTTALRVQGGIEPRLWSSFFGQALLGLGADLARISVAAEPGSSPGNAMIVPHVDGSQWRGAGELSLGVLWKEEEFDASLLVHAIFAFEDVRYSAATSVGEATLVKPWPVQPALSIQGRFRGAL